ncbi:MAG: ribonuclease D [Rickettsiaceae bacterium]|nr:ribonuclease D [Rickettsiaceae bacterium]
METIILEGDIPENFIRAGDIAIDTETMGLNLARDRLCLLQLSFNTKEIFLIKFNKNYDAPNLKRLLQDGSRVKIFHYARFDIAAIQKFLNIEIENIFCTKIASRLVRTYTDYHGLKELCRELLGITLSKAQQSSYWGANTLSKEQRQYAAFDVAYLHELRNKLTIMLRDEERYELAMKICKFLPTRAALDLEGWNDIDIFAH